MERKLFELKVNEDLDIDVNAIALVENPAINVNYLAFSKEENSQFKFSIDEEKKELLGLALIPDLKIPRLDKDGNLFDVYFSKETIRQIVQVFFKKNFQKNINLEHSDLNANCFVFQSYIVDKANKIDSPFPEGVDGSWVVGLKVLDDTIWQRIKNGEFKGFSIEGLFQQILEENTNENVELQSILNNKKQDNNTIMKNKLSEILKKEFEKINSMFANIDTDNLIEIPVDEIKGELKIGQKIERIMSDSTLEVLVDGVYFIDGKEIEIKDEMIVSIDGVKDVKEEADKKEDKKDDKEVEMADENVPIASPELLALISELNAKISEIQKEIDDLRNEKKDDEKVIEEMKSQFSTLTTVLEKFAKIPAEDTKTVKTEKELLKNKKDENMNNFISSFKSLKQK